MDRISRESSRQNLKRLLMNGDKLCKLCERVRNSQSKINYLERFYRSLKLKSMIKISFIFFQIIFRIDTKSFKMKVPTNPLQSVFSFIKCVNPNFINVRYGLFIDVENDKRYPNICMKIRIVHLKIKPLVKANCVGVVRNLKKIFSSY